MAFVPASGAGIVPARNGVRRKQRDEEPYDDQAEDLEGVGLMGLDLGDLGQWNRIGGASMIGQERHRTSATRVCLQLSASCGSLSFAPSSNAIRTHAVARFKRSLRGLLSLRGYVNLTPPDYG